MSYLTDQLLRDLREARQRKGWSQRALSARSGVPQSHISRIENGDVDIRVSSLIALARALELELELVPRKTLPAVQSIVRSSVSADYMEARKQVKQQLSALENVISKAVQFDDTATLYKELKSVMRLSHQIERFQPDAKALKKIARSTKELEKALKQNTGVFETIRKSVEQLESIRNIAAHSPAPPMQARAAYSLDEADDD